MNPKQLVLLIVAVVVVVGLGWMMKSREQASWQSKPAGTPDKVLPDFPLNDITSIKIETKEKTANLNKGESGWELAEREGYPANTQQIGAVLRTFWELKPVQTVQAGESQYARLEVAPPKAEKGSGTLVEFSKGQPVASVILGKTHQSSAGDDSPYGSFPNGRYILVPDKKEIYVVSSALSEVTPEATGWLNRDFVKIENPKSVQVSGKDGVAWEIVKDSESADWKFLNAKEKELVDKDKVSSLGGFIGYFADVAGKRDTVKEPFSETTKAQIKTFDGFTYDITAGTEKEGNRHVTVDVSADLPAERKAAADEKPEDKAKLDEEFKTKQEALKKQLETEKKYSQWVYLIPSGSVDLMFKSRTDLLAPEPAPTATPDPAQAQPAPQPPAPAAAPEPDQPPVPPAAPAPTPAAEATPAP